MRCSWLLHPGFWFTLLVAFGAYVAPDVMRGCHAVQASAHAVFDQFAPDAGQ